MRIYDKIIILHTIKISKTIKMATSSTEINKITMYLERA